VPRDENGRRRPSTRTDAQHRPDSGSSITRGSAVPAYASALVPELTRTCWHALVRCPVCGFAHMCRAREIENLTGNRRLPCGHRVALMIARTYRQRDDE
jgi:hypothetical protein